MKQEKRSTLTIILFVLYILGLTGIILFKLPFYSEKSGRIREINLIPLLGSFDDNGLIQLGEIMGNVVIFIPLGIFVSMIKSTWSFVEKILPIIDLTLVFEIVQFAFAMGRTDITDVLANTLGGIIGVGLYALVFKYVVFKRRMLHG
jgi:glycopeptide antibiotics resistance protein